MTKPGSKFRKFTVSDSAVLKFSAVPERAESKLSAVPDSAMSKLSAVPKSAMSKLSAVQCSVAGAGTNIAPAFTTRKHTWKKGKRRKMHVFV